MNSGKIFENELKDSVKKYNFDTDELYLLRLGDSASGFGMDSTKTRFSMKSPFDFLLHVKNGPTFALELKSTKQTSFAFSLETDEKMIKKSQVKNLERASRYGIISGFLLNFRGTVHTYFLLIGDFLSFASSTEKKSINENDVLALGALRIPASKRKVYYDYDIGVLISYGKNKPVC